LAETDSYRSCDRLARKLLGARHSSVFNPPVRSALAASTWSDAAAKNESNTAKRISKQTLHIIPKIRQVDRFLVSTPQASGVIRETHPEVLFHVLNNGSPLSIKKSFSAGIDERLDILEHYYEFSRQLATHAFTSITRSRVRRDDVIDALICAVVGLVSKSKAGSLPEKPGIDVYGMPMEIVIPGTALIEII
jgi:predicted RNase H-like nuclease